MNKKMTRRLMTVLLSMTMVLCMMPTFAWADKDEDCQVLDCNHAAAIGNTHYDTLAEAVAAAQSGDTVEIIKTGTYAIPNPIDGVTIDGTKAGGKDKVTFDVSEGSGQLASTSGVVTFKAVSFKFGNNGYTGFQHPGAINFNDCNIEGYFQSYGTMNFTDCVFTQTNLNYSMWCYAGDCTYTRCVFNEAEAALNLYNEGNNIKDEAGNVTPWVITVEDCTFNHTSTEKESYSAILLKTYNETAYKLILKGTNTVGEGTWTGTKDNGIVAVSNNNNCLVWVQRLRENEPSSVWQGDTQVWPAPAGVAQIGNTIYETLEAALTASKDAPNTTITLLSDIEVVPTHTINNNYGAVTLGSGYNCDGLILDGNGHTIKLKDNNFSTVKYDVIHISGGNITFKNLIVDANGTGTSEIINKSKCAFSINTASVTFDNVTVKNTNGGWSAFNVNKSTVELNKCTSKDGVCQIISCDGGSEATPSVAIIKSGEYDGTIRTEGSNANNKLYIKGGTYTFNTKNGDLTIDKASGSILEISGGIFSVNPSAYVADGYEAVEQETNPETWTVQKKAPVVIIDDEDPSKQVEIKQDTEVDTTKATQVYGANAEAAKQATKVEGVELTTEGENPGLQQLIDKALEGADDGKKTAVKEAEKLTVDIKVAVEPDVDKSNTNKVVVKLNPTATIKAGDTVIAQNVEVDNDMIDQTKEISVTIYIGFETKQLIHRGDDGKIIEVFNNGDFIYNETDKTATVQINHFSTIEGSKEAYVAEIGDTGYTTLNAAIEAATQITSATADNPTIVQLMPGTVQTGGITLDTTVLNHVVFQGASDGTSALKDCEIVFQSGTGAVWEDVKFSNIIFDNSFIVFSSNSPYQKDLAFDGCTFRNLKKAGEGSRAGVHISAGKCENFTFTNNIFDTSEESHAAVNATTITGNLTITGNTFKNSAWRPLQLQLKSDDDVDDVVVIKNNLFTGNASGVQIVGYGADTDDGSITVQDNAFVDGKTFWFNSVSNNNAINVDGNYWKNGAKPTANEYSPYDCTPTVTIEKYATAYAANESGRGATVSELQNMVNYVAQIGTGDDAVKYETLAEAIKAAQSGDTIELLDNVTLENTRLDFGDQNFNLDLKEKTLELANEASLFFINSSFVVKNGTITGSGIGKQSLNAWTEKIEVGDASVEFNNVSFNFHDVTCDIIKNDSGTLRIVNSALTFDSNVEKAIYLNKASDSNEIISSTVTATNLKGVTPADSAFIKNDDLASTKANLTIKGSTITVETNVAKRFMLNCNTTVVDSTLNVNSNDIAFNNTNLELKKETTGSTLNLTHAGSHGFTNGKLIVNDGCTVNVSDVQFLGLNVGDGSVFKSGSTVNVSNCGKVGGDNHYANIGISVVNGNSLTIEKGANVTVDGIVSSGWLDTTSTPGTLNIADGKYTKVIQGGATASSICISLTGGIYKEKPDDAYVAEGYLCVNNPDMETVETYPYAVRQIIAKIGDTNYFSLQDALNAAAVATDSAKTVTLVADATENVSCVLNSKNVILDMNGKTLTGNVDVTTSGTLQFTIKDSANTGSEATAGKIVGDVTVSGTGTLSLQETTPAEIQGTVTVNGSATFECKSRVTNITTGEGYTGTVKINNHAKVTGTVTTNSGTVKVLSNISTSKAEVGTITKADGATVTITGGVFTSDPSELLGDEYCAVQNSAGKFEVVKAVAKIDTTKYATLADAIAAVPAGGTTPTEITMLCDVTDATGISVPSGKNFIVDFDGHTYTVNKPGAGSTGTTTQAFQLIAGSTAVFKNGKINVAEDNLTEATVGKNIKRLIQNYADLTLENMTLDGTNLYVNDSNTNRAVVETANGNVNINGSTSIKGKTEGDVRALNVDTWKGSYNGGSKVTINTTGTVDTIYLYSEGTAETYTKSSLAITGGKFVSVTGDLSGDYTSAISGGYFSSKPDVDYIAEGYSAISNYAVTGVDATVYPWTVGYKISVAEVITNGTVSTDKTGTIPGAHAGDIVTVTPTPDSGYRVKSVTYTKDGGETVTVTPRSDGTYTFTMPKSNVTISAVFEVIPTPQPEPQKDPEIVVPVSGDESTVEVRAKIEENNAKVETVTKEEIAKVGTGEAVTIDVSNVEVEGKKQEISEVTLTKDTVENVKESEASGLEIKLTTATVVIDQKTLEAVSAQAEGNEIHLVVDKDTKAEQTLTEPQKETIKEMTEPVVLDAYFVSNGKRISDFQGGKVKILVEYPTYKPIKVWYVADDGTKTEVPSSFNATKQIASFEAEHFSHYVVETIAQDGFIATGTAKKSTNTIKWNAVVGADGYDLFSAQCGKTAKKIKSTKALKYTKKSLNSKKTYKYYVRAYQMEDGKKTYIAKTPTIHVAGSKAKYSNASKLTVGVKTLELKAGATNSIKAKITKKSGNKTLLWKNHTKTKIRFMSSDKKVATVNSKGKITAVAAGEAYIYAYSPNGVYQKITVTVK